jgi:hypothetical protein
MSLVVLLIVVLFIVSWTLIERWSGLTWRYGLVTDLSRGTNDKFGTNTTPLTNTELTTYGLACIERNVCFFGIVFPFLPVFVIVNRLFRNFF